MPDRPRNGSAAGDDPQVRCPDCLVGGLKAPHPGRWGKNTGGALGRRHINYYEVPTRRPRFSHLSQQAQTDENPGAATEKAYASQRPPLPAGHLPHRWGDWLSSTVLFLQRLGLGEAGDATDLPPVGEMAGMPEGARRNATSNVMPATTLAALSAIVWTPACRFDGRQRQPSNRETTDTTWPTRPKKSRRGCRAASSTVLRRTFAQRRR